MLNHRFIAKYEVHSLLLTKQSAPDTKLPKKTEETGWLAPAFRSINDPDLINFLFLFSLERWVETLKEYPFTPRFLFVSDDLVCLLS